jgi:hypothetical protein
MVTLPAPSKRLPSQCVVAVREVDMARESSTPPDSGSGRLGTMEG